MQFLLLQSFAKYTCLGLMKVKDIHTSGWDSTSGRLECGSMLTPASRLTKEKTLFYNYLDNFWISVLEQRKIYSCYIHSLIQSRYLSLGSKIFLSV
jgi:hypothetical protein